MKSLKLPCLRGCFGDWTYFSTVIPIRDIVNPNRIITVAESEELYTRNINEIMQREVGQNRIGTISNYLLSQKERFFSSIIVAIHEGNPEWSEFDLSREFRVNNQIIEESEIDYIENKLGVLTLSGSEEMFVLDGQHRLLGIRAAYHKDNTIGNDEISVLFIVHNKNIKERTRRLFTVLNRYAQKPQNGDLVILEEDDASAILTRKLVQEHPIFLKSNGLSKTKAPSLSAQDFISFTTLVTVWDINKLFVDKNVVYQNPKVMKRPSDAILGDIYTHILNFWDDLFKSFPQIENFINGTSTDEDFNRNKNTGGSLLLRPAGQKMIADIYVEFTKKGKKDLYLQKIEKVDFNLSGTIWKNIFWANGKITKNDKFKKNLLLYVINEFKGNASELLKEYRKAMDDDTLNLPPQIS